MYDNSNNNVCSATRVLFRLLRPLFANDDYPEIVWAILLFDIPERGHNCFGVKSNRNIICVDRRHGTDENCNIICG